MLKTTEEARHSFFNFFCNLKTPSKEEISKLDFEDEKELGGYLDTEFEYAMEFIEEFIPHASEYFLGFKTDSEEYSNYLEHFKKEHENWWIDKWYDWINMKNQLTCIF